MHWFRSNIRSSARLALFALAVQMILSLGHVHFYAVAPASAKSAPPAVADGSGAGLLSTRVPIHKSDVDPYCPICAFIQLLTTSAPSAAPALPLPPTLGLIGLRAPAELALALRPQFLFQARAPPSI